MNWLKAFIKTNQREKIFAFVVTFIIWVAVVNKTEETKSFNVKIEPVLAKDKVLSSDTVGFIHVQAVGSKFDFARVTDDDLVLKVDLTDKEKGKPAIYYFDTNRIPLSKYLKISQVFPEEAIFTVAKRIYRTVPVEPYLDGQPMKGYRVEKVSSSPQKVSVSGPEDLILEMDSAPTEKILLAGLKEPTSKTVGLLFRSQNIRLEEDNDKIDVRINIVRDVREAEFRRVPVLLDGGGEADITPAFVRVKLKGPSEELDKLQPGNLAVYVENKESEKYTVGKYYFKNLPDGIEPVYLQKVKNLKVSKKKESDE